MDLRQLSPTVSVSAQLSPDDMPAIAAGGFGRVISNRPDGEEPGQPSALMIEAAAREAGLGFVWIPVSGLPGPDQVAAVAASLADGVPTVMFCRSGMRSTTAWAMVQRQEGADADGLRETAAAAGYDLGRVPL